MHKVSKAIRDRIRIGVDMHVVSGIFQGSRTHCLELFSRVVALTPECDFVMLTANPRQLLSFSESFALPNVEICQMPEQSAPIRLLWQLPKYVKQKNLSLLHTQYVVPPRTSCATAVTVHDILFESHPQYFEKSLVLRSRLLVPFSIRRSAVVFTVSDFSRNHISSEYSVPLSRITTIPNGVDTSRFFPGQKGMEDLIPFGLKGGDYYLTVGRLEPRKNHTNLLRAWSLLEKPRPRLVIVGQRHFGYNDVLGLITELGLQGDVLLLEQISDALIPSIYRNAKGFIYCSWAEGFGMPLLEAMASGIPVISSSNTGLAEVCADAAITANPKSPVEIRDAVLALENRPDLRYDLVSRGLNRIREYTWEKSAHTVRRVYLDYLNIPSRAEINVDDGPDQTKYMSGEYSESK